MNFSEQTVLVTGAGRGLGTSIARAFAAQGARVVVNYRRSQDAAERLAADIGGVALQADITRADQVDAMFSAAEQHFGTTITTVVNNALADFSFDGDARSTADTITWEQFDAQFQGAVRGALITTQRAIGGMRAAASAASSTSAPISFRIPLCRTTITRRRRPRCCH